MSIKNFVILIILSIIWSTTFIFLKFLAPIFGSSGVACFRLLSGSLVLLITYGFMKYKINWKRDWKFLCCIGIINATIPFYCFSFAALYIPTSLSAILNALTPLFGVIFGAIIFKDRITISKIVGLAFGIVGVTFISIDKMVIQNKNAILGIIAIIIATACYGLATNLIKKYGEHVESKALSCGSQLFAGIALVPFLLKDGINYTVTLEVAIIMVSFGVLCSGIAYLIFFYLVKEVGPVSSLTVTFLIPVFSLLWSKIFMHETIYPSMIIGICFILLGTITIVKPSFRKKTSKKLERISKEYV